LVKATSEAPGGTKSTITCVGPSPSTANIGNSRVPRIPPKATPTA
jgi:hypothetical protein